jgi:DNA-binding response OmpR family regulator
MYQLATEKSKTMPDHILVCSQFHTSASFHHGGQSGMTQRSVYLSACGLSGLGGSYFAAPGQGVSRPPHTATRHDTTGASQTKTMPSMRVEATGPCAQQFICFWHGHTDAADTSGYRGIWFATNCRKQARQNARLLLSLQNNITPLIWSSFFCYVAHQNAMNALAVPDRHSEGWPDWSILIVDDEAGMRNFLIKTLAPRCHFVMNAGSAEEGAEWLGSHHVDLIILDISLPGKNGVTWLKELREQGYAGQVIIITAFAELDTAIEALRAGASDFILKPFRVPQILNSVKQCVERARLQRENYVLRRNQAHTAPGLGALVGQSAAMNQLRTTLTRLTQVHSNVLLQGESGTGKELVARAIHSGSPRANAPFVPVNCAALSHELLERELFGHAKGAFAGAAQSREGLFRYAQGGTLFLDEVAELPLPVQATLLQAIDELNIRPVGSEQTRAGERAHHCSHHTPVGRLGNARPVQARPLPPPQGGGPDAAPPAGAHRRHTGLGRSFSGPVGT